MYEGNNVKYCAESDITVVSDIRLIMAGAVILFAGFFVGAITNSIYNQFAIQQANFDDCFDYSNGVAMHVDCTEKAQDRLMFLGLSSGLLGIGGFVIFRGIRGRWDHDVKDSEMMGPRR